MGEDWSRWLDTAPDSDGADEPGGTGKASVVRLRGGSRNRAPGAARPILVVGGCGGAGTTTTALGLAGELGLAGTATIAVDATPAGGDIALRGADEHLHPISLQQWLYGRGDDEPAPLKDCMSRATSGIGLLWRDAAPLRRRASYLTVARAVDQAGYTGIFDGGNPIAGRQLRPLLDDADVALVLSIPARSDAANRLRVTLEWLDDEYGDQSEPMGGGIVGDTTIVVSHQQPGVDSRVADHLREHLSGWVRDIVEVPYDPHLARGELVRHVALARETRQAYERLLAGAAA
ncbi:MinD/ParA family protein [Nocardia sp. NPDC051750]|uniref:MinD/ParA family protein n=1 Tax=Nocardia sp. NPDC051750 TaxID=3364325 RepID=UPI0037B1AA76